MTRKQAERTANILDNIAVAMTLGAGGDWLLTGSRGWVDVTGIGGGMVLFFVSWKLTGLLGGPKIWS